MTKIKNKNDLSTTPLRADALDILSAGLDAIDTAMAVRHNVIFEKENRILKLGGKTFYLSEYKNVYLVAFGKCAVLAGKELEAILGDEIKSGIVLDIQGGSFKKLRSVVGTHPFPSEGNMKATADLVKLVESATEEDLVIVVISGGGSSLLCMPNEMSCENLVKITKILFSKGANIEEINTVRKHLSKVQGGYLAKMIYPAVSIALIFSDVPGDDLSVIASGPMSKDLTTKEMAEKIMKKYDVLNLCQIPSCELVETPKEDKYFEKVRHLLLVNNATALEAMSAKAKDLGYGARIVSKTLEGEAREVGASIAKTEIGAKSVLLYGGETTVMVKQKGKGGRNQEVALGALPYVPEGRVLLACASDGVDNTDMAGAIADDNVREEAKKLSLNPQGFLDTNNSYEFFRQVGAHVKTGVTGSNVSDLYFLISE
jgi:glycerate-2-kinase